MSETFDNPTLEESPTRRLVRVHEGRWLGGVAAGLGRYFDVNPLIYRIAFAALAFAGGTGLLLYVAAWLVMPSEDREESIAVDTLRRHRDHPWLVLGVGLLSFGALLALSEARFWPGPGNVWLAALLGGAAVVWWHVSARNREATPAPTADAAVTAPVARPAPVPKRPSLLAPVLGALLAAAGVVGLLDVVGVYDVDLAIAFAVAVAFVGASIAAGAATGRRVGGLVPVGLVLLACFGVAASVPVSLDAGIGDRVERPLDATSLERNYELGMGDLHVDLSQADLAEGRTSIDARVGIGQLRITVPPEIAVDLEAHTGVGDIEALGLQDDGAGVDIRRFFPGTTPDAPVLELDADVGLGAVEIRRG